MTGLLVSVRSRQEAEIALQAGVRLIDLKEPSLGPLAATSVETWHQVAELVQDKATLSVALGELLDRGQGGQSFHPVEQGQLAPTLATQAHSSQSLLGTVKRDPTVVTNRPRALFAADESRIPDAVSFAKVGLSGVTAQATRWRQTWRAWRNRLPNSIRPVLVHYADGDRCHAPSREETCEAILELRPAAVLIDTFHKEGRNVFDEMSSHEISTVFESARSIQAVTVLGGALSMKTISQAIECQPDWIAVRGAACPTTRRSDIDRRRIEDLMDGLQRHQ